MQRRQHSRGYESVLTNALLLAGTIAAVLVLVAAVGRSLGVFAF